MALRHLSLLCCAIACGALLGGCQPDKKLRKANVDQVQQGMAKKQVESILGMPTTVEVDQLDLNKKITYVYTQGDESVTLVFWDDRLESKVSTFKE
jgi:hypothetical protein